MSLRTILLHAAPDSGFTDRLTFAVALARQSGAAIRAVYTFHPAGVPHVGRALSIYINELVHEAKAKEGEVKARFESATAAAGVTGSWETVEGDVTRELRNAVTFSDLTVVSETSEGTVDDQLAATLPESLALACNGPLVVVPTGVKVPERIGRVLIAWKPSREAGHAVRFALPLLALADKVEVLTIDEGTPGASASGEKLVTFLGTHGVKAAHVHLEAPSAAKAIAAEAGTFGADLIVLGAYSHSRLAEMVLGGVTASMLAKPPAPLFCAH
ncbi:universal stress protein [Ancylobacter pratisalsi]|uniref:Universal stress protein n=1 Tax=Ancylobacter pratisalsi TaxID=1745854 RepID=A0A6P1YTL1_9HYPH|nr:universal stress protein [Ancylobacter pratisalsi]QIB35403.1 universal stress protein [Ancylobacter pratisalsi]